MPRPLFWLVLACAALLTATARLQAAPGAEQLFPDSTKGFLSIGNVERLTTDWAKTEIGQLGADPIMQPFVEDFNKTLETRWNETHRRLSVGWNDVREVAGGEAAIGIARLDAKTAATMLAIDVTGHNDQTKALLARVDKDMAVLKAKASQLELGGAKVTFYAVPKTEKAPARSVYFCLQLDQLLAADNREVLAGMLGRFADDAKGGLGEVPAYTKVMARCQAAAGQMTPHARWFVEPLGYAEAMRIADPPEKLAKPDRLDVFKKQGFDAIQGVGGYLHLAGEKYEVLHQTAVYAPPVHKGEEKRYDRAANMLDFPNGGDFLPSKWIPREVASYTTLNVKPSKMFDASKTLIDALYNEPGMVNDLIDGIKTDPYGSKIDLPKDLIGLLKGRAILVSDYVLPITPQSERLLLAIQTSDEKLLAKNVKRYYETDPDAKPKEHKDRIIWVIEPSDEATEVAKKEDKPAGTKGKKDEEEDDEKDSREHVLPKSAVTVVHGHLLIASDYEFLLKMFDELPEGKRLADSAEYQLVKAELDRLSGKEACGQRFSRSDEELRAVYELIRTGRMPEAETLLGQLLNNLLAEGKHGVARKQQIDGKRLPDYDAVRRYFGPAGTTAVSEDDGWFLTGMLLSKAAVPAQPAAAPAAK